MGRFAVARPFIQFLHDPACRRLEHEGQDCVDERGAGGHEEPGGEPGGEGHVAEIGFVDRRRVIGEESCKVHGGVPLC